MRERELLSMEKMAAEVANAGAQAYILNRVVTSRAVRFISNHRVLQPRKMHANLVRPSGLQLNIDQRKPIKTPAHAIKRNRAASAAHDGHPRPIFRIAGEGWINLAGIAFSASVAQAQA